MLFSENGCHGRLRRVPGSTGCHGRIGFLRPGPGPAAATDAINHPFTGIL